MTGLAESMISRIDRVGLNAAQQRYPNTMWNKFFDLGTYLPIAADHAQRLHSMIPDRSPVLDLGAGFGFVALGLHILGHPAYAIEEQSLVVDAVARCIPITQWSLQPFRRASEKYPDWQPPQVNGDWGLILAHGVVPVHDWNGYWTFRDYIDLMGKLVKEIMPGGQVEWIVNRGDAGKTAFDYPGWQSFNAGHPDCIVSIIDNMITARKRCVAS